MHWNVPPDALRGSTTLVRVLDRWPRMKTACVINGAIAPSYQQALVEAMKNGSYSVAIDGSSDSVVEKMNPLTVWIINADSGKVHTQFLDMCLSLSTAEGIFLNASCP